VYRAPTYKEAVVKAKMELGSDVYIIARKEVKEGGFLGMFGKTMFEITVAKNEENDSRPGEAGKPQGTKQSKEIGSAAGKSGSPASAGETGHPAQQGGNTVLSELMEIKRQLRQVLDAREDEKGSSESGRNAGVLDALLQQLRNNDFSEDYIEGIRRKFEAELTLKDIQDPEMVLEKLQTHIRDGIRLAAPIGTDKSSSRVVVLVGPTGVGKTTTIAKLAASFGVLQKKKVELFTIDSYRIAAIEQLGKYAELMQLPFTVINTRDEFKNGVLNSKAEMIFVDTVGRSQKNNLGLAELRSILDGVNSEMDIHLVISATTKYRDAIDIVTRFNQLMYGKIIVTKLDETNTIGPILSVLSNGKPLSYFAHGQSVPDDIEVARSEKLVEMIAFDPVAVESSA
jgi:flagellar biosynthesis protein FlhF